MKTKIVLTGILILGLLLRFVNLSSVPPSLSWDEVSHGYNAYSILKTGRDEWGVFFPITNFRAYGDYPLPLYMYLSMPLIATFGLNAFSIRFISALLGSLLIIIVYLLTKRVASNKIALLTAFLIAVSPWDILLSRQVLQAIPAIFFMSLGLWLFIKGMPNNKKWIILGTIFLGISEYGYHNTRILAPVLICLLLILYLNEFIRQKWLAISIVGISLIFFVPVIFAVLFQGGSAREIWVGIVDQGAINQINQSRGASSLNEQVTKLVYNKETYFIETATVNYLTYFSPTFLGFIGGSQYQFSVPGFGIVYPLELPFFYLGGVLLLINFRKLSLDKKLIFVWLIISPLPAAITRDPYQVVRATTMIVPYYLVEAYGLQIFISFLKRQKAKLLKPSLIIFCVGIGLLTGRYMYNLLYIYPVQYSFAWQYGYEQVIDYVQSHINDYDQIFITKKYGEPHEFLLFFTSYPPDLYRNDPNLIRYERSDWFWVDRFSKYNFVNDWEIKDKVKCLQKCLLVTSPGNYPQSAKLLQTINFLNNKPAFDIVELP